MVESTSADQSLTLTNGGDVPLTITSITTSGDFAQTDPCGSSVNARAGCTINVTFTPTAAGTRSGTLTVTDNSNGVAGSTQAAALSGMGQDFTIAPSSGSSPTANVAPGQAASYSLTVVGEDGFSEGVNFTCTGAPSEAICHVPPVATYSDFAITVTTTAPSVTAPRSHP